MKLRAQDIAGYRIQQLQQQNYQCALCGEPLAADSAVLDHDHATGLVRGVLHRGCNAFEGQVVRAMPRNLITPQRLAAIFQNWQHYHDNPTDILHPQHRTPEQRQARARKRARARRKKPV